MVMMICMSLLDGWLRPDHELSYVILLINGLLWPYLGFVMILFDRWLHPCHDSCIIWQRSWFMYMYLYLLVGFPMVNWFPALIYKAFHPSIQIGLHALGGIFCTTFCHYPCTPHSLILEDLYSEPRTLTSWKNSHCSNCAPLCTISPENSTFPVYKSDANGLCLPRADV